MCSSLRSDANLGTLANRQGRFEEEGCLFPLQEEVYAMWELSPVFRWGY